MSKHSDLSAAQALGTLSHGGARALWNAPLALYRAFTRYLRDQRDYEELASLPDYLLEDIGITRAYVNEARQRPFL